MADILADEVAFNGADVGTILAELQSGEHGLDEIKGEVNDIYLRTLYQPTQASILWREGGAYCPEGKSIWDALGDGTISLNTLQTLLTDIEGTGFVKDTHSLVNIYDYVETNWGLITALADALSTHDTDIKSRLDNATYGLSALNTDLDAIKAQTDNLPSDPADESELEARLGRKVSCMTWWSDIDDEILLGDAPAADVDLPNVVVSGIPAGATLVMAIVVLKTRAIENTSSSGTNAINGAQNIRVKKSTGAWGTDDVVAINLADNMWSIAASTREYGDVLVGDNDVKSEVDGDATYNLRFEDSLVDYDSLKLNDAQVGIRIWFY